MYSAICLLAMCGSVEVTESFMGPWMRPHVTGDPCLCLVLSTDLKPWVDDGASMTNLLVIG